MAEFDYLIIGGGIAGTTAAETIRKEDSKGSIAIISDEPYPLYSRIMLSKPNWFLGKIPFDKVWLKDESWYKDNNIELMTGKKAINIDPKAKIVSLDDDSKLEYDKILLATGICARRWPVKGAEKNGVFYLRTLDDGKRIIESIRTAKTAVTIGGGFISFEMAALLRSSGIEVTNIILEDYYWQSILDKPAGKIVEEAMESGGVKILRNSEVKEVLGKGKVEGVILKGGEKIDCDMIVCGIGAVCMNEWLTETGVSTDRGIVANKYLETSAPTIWTAGDIAQYKDVILDEIVQMSNWANAQKQGQIAALNMMGKKQVFEFITCYTVHGFNTNIVFIGDIREGKGKEMISRGPVDSSYGRLTIKDGKIIGASLVNRNKEMGTIQQLIKNKVDVSKMKKKLKNPNFDLKKLLS